MIDTPIALTAGHRVRSSISTHLPWRTIGVAAAGLAAGPLLTGHPGARELVIASALVAGSLIDISTRRIPNWLTAGAAAVALASAGSAMPQTALGGVGAGLVGLLLLATSRGNYGMGDVKAMAVCGMALGIGLVPAFVLLMSCSGAVVVLIVAARRQHLHGETLAYGPAIALGYILTALFV